MINKAQIIGRLGQDPDVRYTKSNKAVAALSIATTEKWKDRNGQLQERTEWHRAVAWDRTAEVAQEYLKKGSLVYIEGPLATREWEDKNGQKRYTTEIQVRQLTMLGDSGSRQNSLDSSGRANNALTGNRSEMPNSSVDLGDDFDDTGDGLPF